MTETTKRTLRVDDSLWSRFGAFCRERGVSMTARIIEHMKSDVESHNEGSKDT